MKTLRVAGKRVQLMELPRVEGEPEMLGGSLQVKGLGTVSIRVERSDPDKYKRLVDYLSEPRTAAQIQKEFSLKSWSAAGRMVDAAKAAGVKLFVQKSAPATGRMGRRPYLFSSKPIPENLPPLPSRPATTAAVLERMMERLERLEQRIAPPSSPPSVPPPPASH